MNECMDGDLKKMKGGMEGTERKAMEVVSWQRGVCEVLRWVS